MGPADREVTVTIRPSTGMDLIRLLAARGVDTVFGIPGVHTIELYHGLAGSGIRHVTPRHEQGAGFMADGYARVSGKPGVCLVISGPGMTNILTAMAQAWADSVPMLVISTVNAHGRMGTGRGWLHELPNQQALAAQVSAFSRTVHTPADLAPALDEAFALFAGARPRPVHLEIPIDVMLAPAAADAGPPAPVRAPAPDPAALDQAAAWLAAARAPVILAGGGARRAAARPDLARALDAPVVMTTNARGLLPPGDPLGVSLSPSQPETRALLAGADVVLAIGTELGPTDCDMYEDGGFALPGRVIRIDIDPVQVMRGVRPALAVTGEAGLAAAGLRARIAAQPARAAGDGAGRAARAQAGLNTLEPLMRADLALLDRLRAACPDAPMVGDSTQAVYAGNLGFAAAGPGVWFNSATGFGTLGYALPAAVGAALARGGPALALVGDGGLQFSLGELASAVEAGVQVILLLYDNQGYGEIRAAMQARNVAPLGVDILTPGLPAIARACGWQVADGDTPEALEAALVRALSHPGCTMIRYTDRLRQALIPTPGA